MFLDWSKCPAVESVSRGSKPVAKLIPVGEVKGKRQPGSLKDKLYVGPEFFEPLPGGELSVCE
jgi:antitoxin (DNA-binding transcriptional repressor) of toxin-antitoxin stability system